MRDPSRRAMTAKGRTVALGLLVFIGACSAAPASSTTSSRAAEPSGAASAPPASEAPEPTSTPASSEPAIIGSDTDLASLLPTTVAGTEFAVTSLSGEQAATLSLGRVGGVATELAVDPASIETATAAPDDWDVQVGPEILAVRYDGADAAALLDMTAAVWGGVSFAAGMISVTVESIGGKDVSWLPLNYGGTAETTIYFYAIGDVVFIVTAADRAVAEEALSKLP